MFFHRRLRPGIGEGDISEKSLPFSPLPVSRILAQRFLPEEWRGAGLKTELLTRGLALIKHVHAGDPKIQPLAPNPPDKQNPDCPDLTPKEITSPETQQESSCLKVVLRILVLAREDWILRRYSLDCMFSSFQESFRELSLGKTKDQTFTSAAVPSE